MSTQITKSRKPIKPSNAGQVSSSRSSSTSLSSHLAMVELKQKIITLLSKVADRDTYHIAVEDLEKTIESLSVETLPVILNSLYDSCNDPKPAVVKESIRLLSFICYSHADLTPTHLTKIITHIVKRLKDADSGVRDACREAIGALSGQYMKDERYSGSGSVVALFVKPLFEAMAEQDIGVQSGAAMCMAKMVDCATKTPISAFQKLCPRISKLLNNPNFLAKAALLPVIASLSQVGAIAPHSLDSLLQCIHECLGSSDWATRKAAADTLTALAMHSSRLVKDKADSTLAVLEACHFDKIKPVRESMTETLQLWRKIAEEGGDGSLKDQISSHEQSDRFSMTSGNVPPKAVLILKKKVPALTNKELNPDFFQKVESKEYGDFPVEVSVPRNCQSSSSSNNPEEYENESDSRSSLDIKFQNLEQAAASLHSKNRNYGDVGRYKWTEERTNRKELQTRGSENDRTDTQTENNGHQSELSFLHSKQNWSSIQRQLLKMERQQANLMNMLQDFMGGSHDGAVTLEKRVASLERVVEEMARKLSILSGQNGNPAMGFEGSNRPLIKFNVLPDHSSVKYNGRIPMGERVTRPGGAGSGGKGRGPSWGPDMSDDLDFLPYEPSKSGQVRSQRASTGGPLDGIAFESTKRVSRKVWDKAGGPARLGEGPSARSVWQASKDEATLEAIRVAADGSEISRPGQIVAPEKEALGDKKQGRDSNATSTSWVDAMRALQLGDTGSAYTEILSTGDDRLLVKLMDRTGPVVDQLSNEIAVEVLHALGQFLLDQNLFDISLSWLHQLVEVMQQNRPDVLCINIELEKDILLNLHEASSTMELPLGWDGSTAEELLLQLASAWGIELQRLEN